MVGVEPEREEIEFHTISIEMVSERRGRHLLSESLQGNESHFRLTFCRLKKNFRGSRNRRFRIPKLLATSLRQLCRGNDLLI
jgi:hypothetical protein